MTKLMGLEKRVDSLEPKPKLANARSGLIKGLRSLTETDQVCLAYLIRDLDKENINPDDFEAWLSKRPEDQQALARKLLSKVIHPIIFHGRRIETTNDVDAAVREGGIEYAAKAEEEAKTD